MSDERKRNMFAAIGQSVRCGVPMPRPGHAVDRSAEHVPSTSQSPWLPHLACLSHSPLYLRASRRSEGQRYIIRQLPMINRQGAARAKCKVHTCTRIGHPCIVVPRVMHCSNPSPARPPFARPRLAPSEALQHDFVRL